MKILTISVIPVSKTAEMSALADKITAERPPDVSDVAQYICLSPPFDGIPPNSIVTISIAEVGHHDNKTSAVIAMTTVSNETAFIDKQFDAIVTFMNNDGRFYLGQIERETF